MDNVYFSPSFGSELGSTGSCRNIAEEGDVADWFTEETASTDNKELQSNRAKDEGKSVLAW